MRRALLMLALSWPALVAAAADCAPPRRLQRVDGDDFRHGLRRWRLESEDPRALVTAHDGVLDIQAPAGLSLWWTSPIGGDYRIRFTALALPAPASAGVHAGRLSDLNMFWNASEADGSAPRQRSGRFGDYDDLRAYYVGFGANANRSTRLRVYDGQRRLLAGYADAALRERPEQALPERARLAGGRSLAIEISSRPATDADRATLRWRVDGRLLFEHHDRAPRLQGHFALRTTASRLQVRDFQVLQCR
jgi:hypothetical protein